MPSRIQITELPRREHESEESVWALTWRSGDRSASIALLEGESVVGSSPGSQIRLGARGVAARHFRIRRDDATIFVQPLGRATLSLEGQPLRTLTPISEGKELSFGEVRAFIERIELGDQKHGVVIGPGSVATPEDEMPRLDPVAWQWSLMTGIVEQWLDSPDQVLDRLVRVVQQAAGTGGAALYTAQPGEEREYSLLAEARTAAEEPAPDLRSPDAATFRLIDDGTELVLAVRFAGESEPWQQALCRHALVLTAVFLRGVVPARRTRANRVRNEPSDPWQELAGETIRRHLESSTDMCRCCDTVLLVGETGTGKELVAHGLHRLWKRGGRFVAINCAAIPSELLDAELFGIEAGTATGVTARRGRIDQAEGGTLFLDEVADLPVHLQTKLLRVLQEREFYSVGGSRLRRADIKIIAATNRPASELRAGSIRDDLYFRLSQATIQIPPLRERPADISTLCSCFVSQLERQFGRGISGISVSALDALRRYSWPGNVRELQNVLRVTYASAPGGGVIRSVHLPSDIRAAAQGAPLAETSFASGSLVGVVDDAERGAIRASLERFGNVAGAARSLGLSESYLYRKIRKLGLGYVRLQLP